MSKLSDFIQKKQKPREHKFLARFPDEDYAWLERLAQSLGVSVNTALVALVSKERGKKARVPE